MFWPEQIRYDPVDFSTPGSSELVLQPMVRQESDMT